MNYRQNVRNFWEEAYRRYSDGGYLNDDTHLADMRFALEKRELERIIEKNSSPGSRRRALDVGCGNGRFTRVLATHFEEAVGIDISKTIIEKNLSQDFPPNCRFRHEDLIESAESENGRYDFVYVGGVLMYVDDAQIGEYLQRLRHILREGGVLVLRESVMSRAAEYSGDAEYPVFYRHKAYYREAVSLKYLGSRQNYAYRVGELRKNLAPLGMASLLKHPKISSAATGLLAFKDIVWKPGRNRLVNYYYIFRREDG
ncbi:class I SAM-dependent methyltransferase [Hydrogenimonas sp. SS33]|uniref:class I SAM-dependent methyltransferase n=1 Tax=Hydrogenimonas leucolamina TaxID=2954236 RepID=UPI00336C0281